MAWNLMLILIMIYVSMWMPFDLAFLDSSSTSDLVSNVIDLFFFFDIIFTFFSAYEIENGREETSHKKIAAEYIKFWFWIDLLATIPTELLDAAIGTAEEVEGTSTNKAKLARLARLPRIYRLLRIIRLLKAFKLLKFNRTFRKILASLQLNASKNRIMLSAFIAVFFVHFVSCIWYLQARLQDFDTTTWVARKGLRNAKLLDSYL